MKNKELILTELQNLKIFGSVEPWAIDALSDIIFDDEKILHAFHASLSYMRESFVVTFRVERNELGCFAVCTNSRIIFLKKTLLANIKSEIIIIKNIQSFETKSSNRILLQVGQRKVEVYINEKHLVRNFSIILGSVTSGREVNVDDFIKENEKRITDDTAKKEQEQKDAEEAMRKIKIVVKHKYSKWIILTFVLIGIGFYAYNKVKVIYATNECKSEFNIYQALNNITEQAVYNLCYNNFAIKIDKSKIWKELKEPGQDGINFVMQGYKECSGINRAKCCKSVLDASGQLFEQKLSFVLNDRKNAVEGMCKLFI
jgi:hypothetical protein